MKRNSWAPRHRAWAIGLLAAATLGTTGCGTNGSSCSVKDNADGTATITCTDGTTATVSGKPGDNCTAKDNGDGTKTITCPDGSTFTVRDGEGGTPGTPGTPGAPGVPGTPGNPGNPGENGGNDQVSNYHGQAALLQEEFSTNDKYYVAIAVTEATADPAGLVTIKYTVKDGNKVPVVNIADTAVTFNIAKLVPPDASAKESFTSWVPYIYRSETASAGEWNNAPYNTPTDAVTDQGYREAKSSNTLGTYADNKDGSYAYVFKTDLTKVVTPAKKVAISYERNRLHRVSVMIGGHNGPTGTATFDFVPDGSKALESRSILGTASCQSCHGVTWAAHGGDRMTVENCVTCHTANSFDAQSGNTIDLKVMVHKIHAGAEMESAAGPDGEVWDDPATVENEMMDNGPYAIWGNNKSKHSWWKVGFPAVIENCAKCHTGGGAQVNNWKTVPSRAACGSCHDLTSFVSPAPEGEVMHSGGKMDDDNKCVTCHPDEGDMIAPIFPIAAVHDWTSHDPRNIPEYLPEMTVSAPGNGKYFVAGERPVVTVKLRDAEVNGNPYIDHTRFIADDAVNAVPPGDGPEGCAQPNLPLSGPRVTKYVKCPPKDGKFTSTNFFVYGPRADRKPVLTTSARVVMKSTLPGPFALTGASLSVIFDAGKDLMGANVAGEDIVLPASVTVSVNGSATTGEVSATPVPTTQFTDASQKLLGNLKSWRDHQFAGCSITFTDNGTSGKPTQTLNVLDNIGPAVIVDATINYIQGHIYTYSMSTLASAWASIATAGGPATVTDSTQKWATDQWKGWTLKIISGPGAGQKGAIMANSDSVLTVSPAFANPADKDAVYQIVPFANVAAATASEVVNWLNYNASFKARGIAYLDSSAIASATVGALPIGGTSFTITTGNGVMFPVNGNIILDRFSPSEETLAYTRSGDVFTVTTQGGAAIAHGAKATVQVNLSNIVAIRSRNLGWLYSLQGVSSSALTAIFPAEGVWAYPIHLVGSNTPGATDTKGTASTVSNKLGKQTDAFKNDPAVTWTQGAVTYQLDPVDDLQPGTYIAKIEFADRGAVDSSVNYKAPTVARVKFQVKQEKEELAPATNCGSCHTSGVDDPATQNKGLAEPEKGFVVDAMRHNKLLNNTAPDLCGACHDNLPQSATGDWSGAVIAARRMHAVHNGSALNYPTATVGHTDTEPGRNWDITLPQDVRNCDTTCHPSSGPNATSGTWKTKAARLPCMGCHDSPSATAHFRSMTFDPTPQNPYSGDEQEACKNCH